MSEHKGKRKPELKPKKVENEKRPAENKIGKATCAEERQTPVIKESSGASVADDPQSFTNHGEENIHSANDWEHADLGNEARNDKFLKLLGAKKTDHKGKIIIGDHPKNQHGNPDPDKLTSDLENQFHQGLEHKLKSGRGHIGLGFSDDPAAPERVNKVTKFSDSDDSEAGKEKVKEKEVKEQKVKEVKEKEVKKKEAHKEEPPVKKKFLGFVKSSD